MIFEPSLKTRRTIFALLLLSCILTSIAQSEPQTQATNQQAAEKKAKADTSPVVVQVVTTQKTKEETERERKEAEDKSKIDTQLVELTAQLANYTEWLAYATILLVGFTALLAVFAYRAARDSRDLFLKDQRPWLSLSIAGIDSSPAVFSEDGSLTIPFRVTVENIGKTPAFDAADGSGYWIGYDGAEDTFKGIQQFAATQSASKGKTIFPRETEVWDSSIEISRVAIRSSQDDLDGMNFIVVGYHYRSNLGRAPLELETVRMYKFGIGGIHHRLPLQQADVSDTSVRVRLWKDSAT